VHLCVESLSPEDRIGAVIAKCEDYHDWGVEPPGSSIPKILARGNSAKGSGRCKFR
jgi:hypothetical protein